MGRRKAGIIIVLLLIAAGALWYLRYRPGDGAPQSFDTGGRYDDSVLDDMGVIYTNRSDIYAFNEGYSESDNCPWGFVHNGIDYFFRNSSTVIAAAPGRVERIEPTDYGEGAFNRYRIEVAIRFNATVEVIYNFEPFTQDSKMRDLQLSMLKVEVGDWVAKGDAIATFLYCAEGAHIHFGVVQDNEWRCPALYLSQDAYGELLTLVHTFHPDWDLCYP